MLIPIASKGRASWFTTAIWRSRKVFSAVFVTSAVVVAIGMTVPAMGTGEESSTARAVLTSSIPPTTRSCSRIFRSSRPGHHPPGGVRDSGYGTHL